MRINKKNPKHWYCLIRSGANVILSAPFRRLPRRYRRSRIVFYDQMNGNAKAFADYLSQHAKDKFELCFLAYPAHHRLFPVDKKLMKPLNPLRLRDMIKVARADVIITNFSVDTLVYYQKFTDIKFINVWHGVGFRNHEKHDFRHFQGYAEVWVTSLAFKELYEKWGWAKDKIKITGYARVDNLVNGAYSRKAVLRKYKIEDMYKSIILVAPTWQQKDNTYNPLPFSTSVNEFLTALNEAAKKVNSLVIFRSHLQSGKSIGSGHLSNVRLMASYAYPDTEEMLFISDMLISDWSSILFDYLPLHRPTLFLDVPSPYKEHTVNQEYRYGEVVGSIEEMVRRLEEYATHPENFVKKFANPIHIAEDFVWGNTLDGKSTERYYAELQKFL